MDMARSDATSLGMMGDGSYGVTHGDGLPHELWACGGMRRQPAGAVRGMVCAHRTRAEAEQCPRRSSGA